MGVSTPLLAAGGAAGAHTAGAKKPVSGAKSAAPKRAKSAKSPAKASNKTASKSAVGFVVTVLGLAILAGIGVAAKRMLGS
jgi:hypothetical protein